MKRPIYSAFLLLAVGLICAVSAVAKEKPLSDKAVFDAMKKATTFMVEKVSNNGGYLWNYAPDFSRVWGELECKPSMMWIERGTPAMGNVFLDAYHATGDEYYFKAAEAAAVVKALVDQLKEKDYWPGKLPGVSRENPGFSDAPLPSEVISTWNYVQNMTRLINYITVR